MSFKMSGHIQYHHGARRPEIKVTVAVHQTVPVRFGIAERAAVDD